MPKTLKNFRLSDVAVEILDRRSSELGVSEAAWIEMQIRAADAPVRLAGEVDSETFVQPIRRAAPNASGGDFSQFNEPGNSMSPEASEKRKAKRETKTKRKAALRSSVGAALAGQLGPVISDQHSTSVVIATPYHDGQTYAQPVKPCPIHSPKFCEQSCKHRQ